MSMTTKDKKKLNNTKEKELWSKINLLLGQHVTSEKKLKLRIRQSMNQVLQIGELLMEAKTGWKAISKAERPDWEEKVAANCSVDIREAQRYMRVYNKRGLLDTLYQDWRDELTLTGALKALSEHFGKKDSDDGDDDDDQHQQDDGGDAEGQAEDGEKNEESETDSETSEDTSKSGGGSETENSEALANNLFLSAGGALKRLNSVIKTAPNRQALSAIASDLEQLRADLDRRIKQCHRRLKFFGEVEGTDTAPTVNKANKKRPAKPKPPIRPGRAGYESSPTGMSGMV